MAGKAEEAEVRRAPPRVRRGGPLECPLSTDGLARSGVVVWDVDEGPMEARQSALTTSHVGVGSVEVEGSRGEEWEAQESVETEGSDDSEACG